MDAQTGETVIDLLVIDQGPDLVERVALGRFKVRSRQGRKAIGQGPVRVLPGALQRREPDVARRGPWPAGGRVVTRVVRRAVDTADAGPRGRQLPSEGDVA